MPFKKFYRITPKRTCTLNNRWYDKVWPKHTLFFCPLDEDQLRLWVDFLCIEHKRSFLYVHTVNVHFTRFSWRKLPTQRQLFRNKLTEIMIKDYNFLGIDVLKTRRKFRTRPKR